MNWLGLILFAFLAALAWTWCITWFINRYGNYPEDEEGRPQETQHHNETEQP